MNAQNLISHRMFVAALSHDEYQPGRKAGDGASSPAPSNRRPRASHAVAPESPGTVAQQLLLLSDVTGFQPAQT